MEEEFEVSPEDHELVQELYQIWDNLNQSRMLEAWHDAQQIREETLDLFSHGIVDLKTRAQIERLYWSVCREINHIVSGLKHAPDEFRNLDKLLADKYFCNFSLFQHCRIHGLSTRFSLLCLFSVWMNVRIVRLHYKI